jgi:hypothetical protein
MWRFDSENLFFEAVKLMIYEKTRLISTWGFKLQAAKMGVLCFTHQECGLDQEQIEF